MYGKFAYIYHKNQPNVGKYTIHGSCGIGVLTSSIGVRAWNKLRNIDDTFSMVCGVYAAVMFLIFQI